MSSRDKELESFAQSCEELSSLQNHDVAFKFWLPTVAAEALKALCDYEGASVSESLRRMLVVHCYGVYSAHVLGQQHVAYMKADTLRFSVHQKNLGYVRKKDSTYWVPELGKNVAPIKIWIAQKLRDDLSVLANHVSLKPSQYVREIVVSRLFGHGTLPRRPESFSRMDANVADTWADDGEIKWVEVTQEEYEVALVGRAMEGSLVIEEK